MAQAARTTRKVSNEDTSGASRDFRSPSSSAHRIPATEGSKWEAMIARRARPLRRAFELQSAAICQIRPETLSQQSAVGKLLSLRPQRPGEQFSFPTRRTAAGQSPGCRGKRGCRVRPPQGPLLCHTRSVPKLQRERFLQMGGPRLRGSHRRKGTSKSIRRCEWSHGTPGTKYSGTAVPSHAKRDKKEEEVRDKHVRHTGLRV